MKRYKFLTIWALLSVLLIACNDDDDDKIPGNPVIADITSPSAAMFGDSISFSAHVSDNQVALSTLKVYLYYGEEVVDEMVIRTKEAGNYSGKLFAPFLANIPNGTATLKFVLQNIHMTIKEVDQDLPLTRPDFSYLTFVSEDGNYRMERTGLYQYELTDEFPIRIKGYIEAPVVNANSPQITFGWGDNGITEGSTDDITFSYYGAGEYTISFNTLSYEAAPFIVNYVVNGEVMNRVDDTHYSVDLDLEQGGEVEISGIDGIEDWWMDPDFFAEDGDGNYTFVPLSGRFRITADFDLEYFRVEALTGSQLATLSGDGSNGAIWIIGDNVGKPSVSTNQTSWTTEKGLLMARVGEKKYSISFVAGETISVSTINFKFFHQRGWGSGGKGEFTHSTLTTTSNIVFIGDGTRPDGDPLKRDSGNLGLVDGEPLTEGKTYVFTIEITDTNSDGEPVGVLTVVEK